MKRIIAGSLGLLLSIGLANAQTILNKYQPGFREINGSQLNLMVDQVNGLTGNGTAGVVKGTNGSFSGTLAVTGAATLSGTLNVTGATALGTLGAGVSTVTSASANALAVGLNGATNPAFNVDASTGSQVAGLSVKGAIHNGTVAIVATDSSGATNLTINALSTGTIGIGSVSTGVVTITPALILGGLGTDSGQTATATVCEDTTTHQTYFGSGAAGICKGTSSRRFKHDIQELNVGLDEILKLRSTSYYLNANMGDPTKKIYGFIAEESAEALPELVGYDSEGKISSFDLVGVIPVLAKAIQQLEAKFDSLLGTRSASYTK